MRNLKDFFGEDKPLQDITPADAQEFEIYLDRKLKLAPTTIGKRIQVAKQFFRFAKKRRMIIENPFEDLVGGNKSNPSRARFIECETVDKILKACPDAEWRLIVALSRYGALRCPSEYVSMKWEHVDWTANKITILSQKTKRYDGKDQRVIPIFPELREPLREVWQPELEYVINCYRGENPRTGFLRILKRAGTTPWPRLFHNMRASRQTELEEQFPTHVVCYWCGNSQQIARKHYLQVTDKHYARALQNPVHQLGTTGTNEASDGEQEMKKPLENQGFVPEWHQCTSVQVAEEGLEPPTRGL